MVTDSSFSVFIKHDRTYSIYGINSEITLNELKYKISEKIDIPVYQFYIISCGKILDTIDYIKKNPTIAEYNSSNRYKIDKDRTIFVIIHSYENIYKKFAYFFYENRCQLVNIEYNNNSITNEHIMNMSVKLYK